MYERNANDATWYMLRYATDFTPRTPDPSDPAPPELDRSLFYDDGRGVLELLPAPLAREATPPAGLAVAPSGEIYRSDSTTGRVFVVRCDGSEADVTCEPRVFAGPRGLALDRRNFLYVADARARRVVVLDLSDGSGRAILNGGVLTEPVDVAVAPNGHVYVADRDGGKIAVYRSLRARGGTFIPQNEEGLPANPRPIAVMIAADGTVLVADANHPRVLHFDANGVPLADLEISTLVRGIPAREVALDALKHAYGSRMPRFIVGTCAPPLPARDAGSRLAEVHRALRLLALALRRRFETSGTFVSAALDSGALGTTWHRIEVDADIPPGTTLTIEAGTSDRPFLSALADWRAPTDAGGRVVPFSPEVREQLVLAPPGRYLRLRATFSSSGEATPSVRSIRILYPRQSYLYLLPRAYRRDAEGAEFLERFLAIFERTLTGVEDRYEEFSRELNPDAAPRELVDWLACLIDLAFDPSWSLEKRRALIASAMELYKKRGTIEGLERYVEIYTGRRPKIVEAFLERPGSGPPFLGRRGSVLGCSFRASSAPPEIPPLEDLYHAYAHRFSVLIYLDDGCDLELVLPVVDRIVTVNKPAHTEHELRAVLPDARLGLQSSVGLDFVIGAPEISTSLIELIDPRKSDLREVS